MRCALPLLALPLLVPLPAQARPGWTTGTFVYADLCTAPSGAVAGRRVVVRRSPNGNDVTYQAALGALSAPMPADALSIDDERREIAFTVEGADGPVRFQGTAAATVLSGTLTDRDGEHPLQLRRVLRSRADEACRPDLREPEATGSTD